jgi:hypothetical protein
MGLEYAPSIGEGLKLIEESHPEAKVAIFPAGGLIVPVIAWERKRVSQDASDGRLK